MSTKKNYANKNKKMPCVVINKNLFIKRVSLFKNIISEFKEDMIYKSQRGDFLKLDHEMTLLNRLSIATKSSITIAKCKSGAGKSYEKTSDNISKLIGQSNYDTVFSALCSVINHELKIRGILALLTIPKETRDCESQTEEIYTNFCTTSEKSCQTLESTLYMSKQTKTRVRKKVLKPYVVTDKESLNKVVIDPLRYKPAQRQNIAEETICLDEDMTTSSLPDLSQILNENSNDSLICNTLDHVPIQEKICYQNFDSSHKTELLLLDGTKLTIPFKIEDVFHIATPDVLKSLPFEDRKKVMLYQATIDWKNCLTPNEEQQLPIHLAAMNGDFNLLRRQCAVLKARGQLVDISNDKNLTALQLSIYSDNAECTALMLEFGADFMVTDDEHRNCFHAAAEVDPAHLIKLVQHCRKKPLEILKQNEEMWKPELENESQEFLANYLLKCISTTFDSQGYTPLMLACQMGKYENVEIFIKACPEAINTQTPNSGNTALYLAIASACLDCSNRVDNSKVSDDYKKTIELLVENGADPGIVNYSGTNVNTILSDVAINDLSMIVANKLTVLNCCKIEKPKSEIRNDDTLIIIKKPNGSYDLEKVGMVNKPKEQIQSSNREASKCEINKEDIKSEVDKCMKVKLIPLASDVIQNENALRLLKLNENKVNQNNTTCNPSRNYVRTFENFVGFVEKKSEPVPDMTSLTKVQISKELDITPNGTFTSPTQQNMTTNDKIKVKESISKMTVFTGCPSSVLIKHSMNHHSATNQIETKINIESTKNLPNILSKSIINKNTICNNKKYLNDKKRGYKYTDSDKSLLKSEFKRRKI